MKYTNKTELQNSLRSFLKQRKHFYQQTNQTHLANLCWNMEVRFDLINKWNYWRHCLEVRNLKSQLYLISPSRTGGQRKIWESLDGLIRHAEYVTSVPMMVFMDQNREVINYTKSFIQA